MHHEQITKEQSRAVNSDLAAAANNLSIPQSQLYRNMGRARQILMGDSPFCSSLWQHRWEQELSQVDI